ncbi:MAG: DNA polymerase I [Phycisphaerales bacterium]
MSTLYLIDGYAQFFRAYHAIRTPMTSPVTGEPTNATFGFVGMLLKVLREEHPSHLAVALDVSGDRGTFRSRLYPDYKATRTEPPEDLAPQVQRCMAILEAINVPLFGAEGYEADDVIATVATRLASVEDAPRIRIVSKDKDLRQLLVQGRVEMYDVHTGDLMDAKRLHEEFGIEPSQVIDMLALMGDTADNVPGVPGIGPKTAAKLIAEYGSLDALIADAPNIKGKRGENIRAAAQTLPLSRQLVTLVHDVDIPFELSATTTDDLHLTALEPILRELGFNRFREELKQLLGGEHADTPDPPKTARSTPPSDQGGLFDAHEALDTPVREVDARYRLVRTKGELATLCRALREAGRFAIDTETTSVHPMQADLCGVSVSAEPRTGAYIPVRSPTPGEHMGIDDVLETLATLLEDPSVEKVGHNLKYDILVLRRCGIELRGVAGDSMIASYILDASRSSHGLDHLALSLLGHSTIPISDLIGTGRHQRTFDAVPLDAATDYAAEDADISLRLDALFSEQLDTAGLTALYRDTELALMPVLAELQWNGIRVDPDELDAQAQRLGAQIDDLREQIERHAPRPFNPDSPKQLSAILFNSPEDEEPGLGIKPITKTKTGYSTNAEVLEKLAADPDVDSPVPALIVEYRQLTKLVNTYLVALKEAIHPDTGRVHASFNQTIAATGRLSSSDPNLQNIPIRTQTGREIRRAFVADAGNVLIGADYSQIELRLLAHLSEDPALIDAFHRGEDIHRAVASQIHDVPPDQVTKAQRDGAKMVNFGIVYGITPFGLARRLGVSNDEASVIIDGYKRRFAGITTFLEECVEQARTHGYVQTILGRRRPIHEIDSRQPNRRALAERMAINSVVQGSAADLIKVAMIRMHGALCPDRALAPVPPEAGWGLPDALASRRSDIRMLLQIHDELVLEAPEDIATGVADWMTGVMEGAMALRVPLSVEVAWSRDWYAGK